MDEDLLNSLVEDALDLTENTKDVLDPKFEKQTDFILESHKRKALWCTRRAAKSYTAGIYLVQTAMDFPGCNCLYLGLTRASAKGIIWKDILVTINRKHDLNMDFNKSELTATTQNSSVIYITGVDAEEDEMHKLLGKKWKLVIIDEAQSYSIDLRTLVYGILGPAMIDEGGTICVMGTSGNLTEGLFFDITNEKEPGWELFQWSAHDNPYVARQWQEELDDIKANRPLFMETALFQQWYLNKWVIDENAKVYKFSEHRNTLACLPQNGTEWHYVLGLDLAHSPDSTAFVVGAYHEGDRTLYFVYSYKATKMDITAVADTVTALDAHYKFEVKIVDGANSQAVAELNNRKQMNLIPADKRGKADFIKIMNDEFIQAKIQCLPATHELQAEYKKLIWVTDANGNIKEPRVENPIIHNDLCDSALYLWRYCYQYIELFQVKDKWIDPHDQKQWEKAHLEKLQLEVKKSQNPNELDLQWQDAWDQQDEEFQ